MEPSVANIDSVPFISVKYGWICASASWRGAQIPLRDGHFHSCMLSSCSQVAIFLCSAVLSISRIIRADYSPVVPRPYTNTWSLFPVILTASPNMPRGTDTAIHEYRHISVEVLNWLFDIVAGIELYAGTLYRNKNICWHRQAWILVRLVYE
jgi:hypothetical protein